jgi:hypothetical protein
MSLFKDFGIVEKANFQLRFESFNVFNHTQWGSASTTLGPGFGSITSVRPNSPRVVQLGGRFSF